MQNLIICSLVFSVLVFILSCITSKYIDGELTVRDIIVHTSVFIPGVNIAFLIGIIFAWLGELFSGRGTKALDKRVW